MLGIQSRAESRTSNGFDVALAAITTGILVLAAVLTILHLVQGGTTSVWGLSWPRWVVGLQVGSELLLAGWLWTPGWWALKRRVMIALFLVYAAVNAVSWAQGAETCGCFGQFSVSPAIMLIVDGLLVCAWTRMRESAAVPALAILLVGAAAVVPVMVARYQPIIHRGTSEPLVTGENPPQTSAPPPGTDGRGLDDVASLATGKWTVVLYSDTCPHCRRDLPRWIAAAERRPRGLSGHAWTFVAVGPPGSPPLLDEHLLPESIPTWRIASTGVGPLPCALRIDHGRLVERLDRVP